MSRLEEIKKQHAKRLLFNVDIDWLIKVAEIADNINDNPDVYEFREELSNLFD